jgi:hypothetical protein
MTGPRGVKPMRKAGEVPGDYQGPVYWRVCQYGVALMTGNGGEPIVSIEGVERNGRSLWREPSIYASGDVFDENGEIFPEWREPLKAKWNTDQPIRVEYSRGKHFARVSERVLDAIESLEPGMHPAFPIDIYAPSGRVDRRYHVFFAQDALLTERELHVAANNLEMLPSSASDPSIGDRVRYRTPFWMGTSGALDHHFGYLDRLVVGDRHWFKGTDTNHIFSTELFAKLEPMGDIFLKWDMALPMGIAG